MDLASELWHRPTTTYYIRLSYSRSDEYFGTTNRLTLFHNWERWFWGLLYKVWYIAAWRRPGWEPGWNLSSLTRPSTSPSPRPSPPHSISLSAVFNPFKPRLLLRRRKLMKSEHSFLLFFLHIIVGIYLSEFAVGLYRAERPDWIDSVLFLLIDYKLPLRL